MHHYIEIKETKCDHNIKYLTAELKLKAAKLEAQTVNKLFFGAFWLLPCWFLELEMSRLGREDAMPR